MVLSHRAKFQLIINFFRVKAISTGLSGLDVKLSEHERIFYSLHHIEQKFETPGVLPY